MKIFFTEYFFSGGRKLSDGRIFVRFFQKSLKIVFLLQSGTEREVARKTNYFVKRLKKTSFLGQSIQPIIKLLI